MEDGIETDGTHAPYSLEIAHDCVNRLKTGKIGEIAATAPF